MRTTKPLGNIIQKGQSSTPGGYFKIQAPNGIVQCLFRGAGGSRAVGSGRAGGKVSRNQTTVTCDYYVGDLDYVRIDAG